MTNKVQLRTVEEFMSDYVPTYQPLYPLFMEKSQEYSAEVGKLEFRRVDTVGDIRAAHITPKDSTMKQVAVGEGKKTFKKYFFGNQFKQSIWQDREGVEDVVKQIIDENQKLQDDLFLLGEGTSNSTMVNNGLFWSSDANYRLENSIELDKGTAEDHLKDMHQKIMVTAAVADQIAGRKVLIIYGSTACAKFDSLYANTDAPFKEVLAKVLGPNYSIVKLPSAVTPASANGWIIANRDQVKLHHTLLPQLLDQGTNSEQQHVWHNFALGSMMLEVLVDDAVIRQPVTFEA